MSMLYSPPFPLFDCITLFSHCFPSLTLSSWLSVAGWVIGTATPSTALFLSIILARWTAHSLIEGRACILADVWSVNKPTVRYGACWAFVWLQANKKAFHFCLKCAGQRFPQLLIGPIWFEHNNWPVLKTVYFAIVYLSPFPTALSSSLFRK